MRPVRIYVDSSVFGGVFDDEFADASKAFFDAIEAGRFDLVVSVLIRDELNAAPSTVQAFFERIASRADVAIITEDAILLQQAYLNAKILSETWQADALHVALATVSACRAIVSWNFKHIVNFRRIPLYNGINLAHGFPTLGIHTPQEMIDETDD